MRELIAIIREHEFVLASSLKSERTIARQIEVAATLDLLTDTVFDVTGPQGPVGPMGPQGPVGPMGPQGVNGINPAQDAVSSAGIHSEP